MAERMEQKAGMRPWLKLVFALSLALNLLVLGAVGGVVLRHGGFDGRHHHMAGGPMTRALSKEDKRVVAREMRRSYRERGRDGRAAYGAAMQQLVAGLRAEPFDPAPVAKQMSRMREMLGQRVAIGQRVLLEHLEQMEPGARRAFAARLEQAMQRRWKDHE